MTNDKRSILEIDMQKLALTYLDKWWLLLSGTLVAAVISFLFTTYFITPMYSASVTIYVNSIKGEEEITYISNTSLATAQRLVNTYIKIIESDSVLSKVAEASGLDISAGGIRAIMSAAQVDNTELFKVRITHEDPRLAAQIANAIAEVAPSEIEGFVEGSSTKIIDYAKVPQFPTSPDTTVNCLFGGMVGLLVMLSYLAVRFLLEVRIKDEEELTTLFDIPVLGQIPVFVRENGKRYEEDKKTYATNSNQKRGGGN